VVRLPSAKGKNKDGRLLPLSGEPLELIERAHQARRLDCPFVFHRKGKPIAEFRKAWDNARKAAGLGRPPADPRYAPHRSARPCKIERP
jgi:integrase